MIYSIDIEIDIDIDLYRDTAVSINRGPLIGSYRAPLKGLGVDVRQVWS